MCGASSQALLPFRPTAPGSRLESCALPTGQETKAWPSEVMCHITGRPTPEPGFKLKSFGDLRQCFWLPGRLSQLPPLSPRMLLGLVSLANTSSWYLGLSKRRPSRVAKGSPISGCRYDIIGSTGTWHHQGSVPTSSPPTSPLTQVGFLTSLIFTPIISKSKQGDAHI